MDNGKKGVKTEDSAEMRVQHFMTLSESVKIQVWLHRQPARCTIKKEGYLDGITKMKM